MDDGWFTRKINLNIFRDPSQPLDSIGQKHSPLPHPRLEDSWSSDSIHTVHNNYYILTSTPGTMISE